MMKKIFISLILILVTCTIVHAQTGWVDYKVDNRVSVKLPSQPQIKQGYPYAKDKDSSVYIVIAIDFVKATGIDSTQLLPLEGNPDFGNSLKTGMLGQMPGSTLGDVKIGKWNGHYTYKVDGGNESKKVKEFTYMIAWGNYMYSLIAIVPDGKSTQGKDDFFASVKAN